VIVSFHGADAQIDLHKPAYLQRTREMLSRARLLLVRSESLRSNLVVLGADPAKVRIHRTGVPLAAIQFMQRSAPTNGKWRCLQACRLIEKKGLATTLRAFAEFADSQPLARLTIAGEGPQLGALQVLADQLRIGDRVTFTGFVSQEKLRSLFAEAHLFLHPSELGMDGNQEGVPNSMLEAMASGLPVLGTNHGGIPEAVEHGVSGLLTSERDARALVESMRKLAADPALFSAMSAAARQRVESEFDLDAQARVLEALYLEALAES
jgi:colanic acid/amylovoran biosynthesis glycosyltransferase